MTIGSLSPVLFAGRTPVPLDRRWLLFVLLATMGIVGSVLLEAEIFVPIALVAALLAGLTFRMPVVWLVAVVLFHLDILRRTEEISVGEILFAVVGFGYTVLWFVRRSLTGTKIVWHRSDVLWFGFFAICLLSAIPAFVYQVDPIRWVRWIVYFLPYFLVFPAREILSERRMMPWIAGAFLLLAP